MNESKNIFKYDGPVGRKTFFISLLIILTIGILIILVTSGIKYFIGVNIYTKPLIIALIALYMILSSYLIVVNYSKRLYDIIGDKNKALFYMVLVFIANTSISYIPQIRYLSSIIGILIIFFLLFRKGKVLSYNNQITETENNES